MQKEFHLAKNYSMHKPSSKIEISKQKLTKHFKQFSERVLQLPPELTNPENFDYLKGSPVAFKPTPWIRLNEASKTFKNNKLFGTETIFHQRV